MDVDNNYAPKYITIRGKGDVIRELKDSAKKADTILLATDPDREGEAISWHLAYILGVDPESECRIEFNEITENAEGTPRPGPIDKGRVVLSRPGGADRLVGYKLIRSFGRKCDPDCPRTCSVFALEIATVSAKREFVSENTEPQRRAFSIPRGRKFERVPENDKRLTKEDTDRSCRSRRR